MAKIKKDKPGGLIVNMRTVAPSVTASLIEDEDFDLWALLVLRFALTIIK